MRKRSINIVHITGYLAVFFSFFAGFQFNFWNAAPEEEFNNFFKPDEALIIGRLVKSQHDGIFSSAGLSGSCIKSEEDERDIGLQFHNYKNGIPCDKYRPYQSQIGFPGIFFSILDNISPFTKQTNIFLFRAITGFLLAFVLSIVVRWFHLETGFLSALFLFIGILLSIWITFMGNVIWYQIWVGYLPFLVLLFLLRKESQWKKISEIRIIILTSLAVFINFLVHGYEWASSILFMTTVPLFYYWFKDNWNFRRLARRFLYIAIGSVSAMATTFIILAWQISVVTGSFINGINYIIFSFNKRAHGLGEDTPERIRDHFEGSYLEIFNIYFSTNALSISKHITYRFPSVGEFVQFYELILLFLIVSLLSLLIIEIGKISRDIASTTKALIAATWISMLAPFTWFIIFKGHSYSHTHMDPITWYMPFCLLGFAMVGMFFNIFYLSLRKK